MRLRTLALLYALAIPLAADEGMWLFNQFPKDTVKQKYTFDVTDSFLDHLRLSSLRIGSGSGAFVSPTGLIVTTRRLAAACIGQSPETACPGIEASVVLALEDVTTQIKNATATERNTTIARIEKDCAQKTGNSCSVVKLYAGERYDLYQSHRYTDLR